MWISVVRVSQQLHSHFNVFWLWTLSHSESLDFLFVKKKNTISWILFRGHRERLKFLKIAKRLLLARGVWVSKTGREKAMQGCLDLQLCLHPPIHPSLYPLPLLFPHCHCVKRPKVLGWYTTEEFSSHMLISVVTLMQGKLNCDSNQGCKEF